MSGPTNDNGLELELSSMNLGRETGCFARRGFMDGLTGGLMAVLFAPLLAAARHSRFEAETK